MNFLVKNHKSSENTSQISDFILGDSTSAPVVAPLAPQFVLGAQNIPKVFQKCLQGGQSTSETGPKLVKVMSKVVLKC